MNPVTPHQESVWFTPQVIRYPGLRGLAGRYTPAWPSRETRGRSAAQARVDLTRSNVTQDTPVLKHAKLIEQFKQGISFDPRGDLQLAFGSFGDYHALDELHYRAGKPATVTRVLTYRHHRPTVVGRYLGRRDQSQVVGVLVESMPTLTCRMRNWALQNRYCGALSPSARACLVNQEVRCISRVIIDPRWRGMGLAVALVKEILASSQTIYTEALAAMGKVHPLFERGGMKSYRRPAHVHDARLTAVLGAAGFRPIDLAVPRKMWRAIESMGPSRSAWLSKELARWYRSALGRFGKKSNDPREHLRAAQQRLMFKPVYYLKDNRV